MAAKSRSGSPLYGTAMPRSMRVMAVSMSERNVSGVGSHGCCAAATTEISASASPEDPAMRLGKNRRLPSWTSGSLFRRDFTGSPRYCSPGDATAARVFQSKIKNTMGRIHAVAGTVRFRRLLDEPPPLIEADGFDADPRLAGGFRDRQGTRFSPRHAPNIESVPRYGVKCSRKRGQLMEVPPLLPRCGQSGL